MALTQPEAASSCQYFHGCNNHPRRDYLRPQLLALDRAEKNAYLFKYTAPCSSCGCCRIADIQKNAHTAPCSSCGCCIHGRQIHTSIEAATNAGFENELLYFIVFTYLLLAADIDHIHIPNVLGYYYCGRCFTCLCLMSAYFLGVWRGSSAVGQEVPRSAPGGGPRLSLLGPDSSITYIIIDNRSSAIDIQ